MQGKRSTLPPIEELIQLHGQFPMSEIARQISADARYEKVSGGTIRNVLIAAGCKMRPRGGAGKGKPSPRKITDLPWEEIIHKYMVLGLSGETISLEYKVGANTIYRGLVERNVEVRERTAHMKGLWEKRNAKLTERERLKNIEGLDLKTGLQISLLAHRLVEGASLYDMRKGDVIYPNSQNPFAALRQLQKRFAPIVKAEQARISALEGEHRTAEKALLSERLRREEAKPKKQVRR